MWHTLPVFFTPDPSKLVIILAGADLIPGTSQRGRPISGINTHAMEYSFLLFVLNLSSSVFML